MSVGISYNNKAKYISIWS